MFSGFVNIWNYFSENVTALRMRDNCWGVTQRRSALPLATKGTQELGDGIQGEMVGDARAAAEQQLVAFEGRGASVRSMRSRIKGWERYVNKENTENMKKEGRKVPEM